MGQLSHCGKLGYLEDENGGPIATTMVKGIHKALRADLGVVSASGHKLIHTLMEDTYPLLKFADNGWKLEYLASTSYSAWHRTYLTDDGNWKLKNHDNEDKDESEDGNTGDSQTLSLKGKKHKKAKFSIKSEVPQKKMKVDSKTAGTQTLVVSPLPSSSSPTPSAAMAPTSLTLDLPTPDPPTFSLMALTSLTPRHLTPSMMAPMAALALTASKIQLPPLPLGPTPPIVPPAPNGADSESTTQNHAGLSTADDTTTSKTTTVSTKSSTKGKMCLSSTKNGCNLCAQQWLKKLKTNRTTKEFCAYYRDLMPAQQKLYDDESASLVTNKSWNKTSFNGTMY
ncbi:hypothetical protein BDR05DRAFT_943602 [Suillus weaverae]|nr:hypothetical protein BDR05DRAFT_943602 [Suillus weaverae]